MVARAITDQNNLGNRVAADSSTDVDGRASRLSPDRSSCHRGDQLTEA